ncbi:MAG: metallophosphoesterase family protein [Proteobacteria bacterium]|nr:metallophosphoesterase family protein [Pseudomonadota bacterium]
MTQTIRRLGIIGDVHCEHLRLDRALGWLAGQQLDAVICTGDLADGVGCLDECARMLEQAQVVCVSGNHDRWLLTDRVRHLADAQRRCDLNDATIEYLSGLKKTESISTTAGPALLCHGVQQDDLGKVWPGTQRSQPERHAGMDSLLLDEQVSIMINGHLHYRVLIDFHNLLLINAGTLRGEHGGIAVLDIEADEIAAYEFETSGPGLVRVVEHALLDHDRECWKNPQAFSGDWTPVTLYGH